MAIVNATALIAGVGGNSNFIDNPRAEGSTVGAIGSGGVLPTNWSLSNTNTPAAIAGVGTDGTTGLPYTDVQFSGTTGSLANGVLFVPALTLPTNSGDQWTLSFYAALVGGTTSNVTSFTPAIYTYDASGAILSGPTQGSAMVLTATPQRFSATFTVPTNGAVRYIRPIFWINFANTGVAVNFTIRLVGPQFEQDSVVTALMLPPAGAPAVTNRAILAQPGLNFAQARIAGAGGVRSTGIGPWYTSARIAGLGGPTNFIRNPNAEGAVAGVIGSGGAWPTFGWAIVGTDNSGLTKTIIGTGTDATTGLPYIDIRYSGTTAASNIGYLLLTFDSTGTTGAPGDQWAESIYIAMIAGSLANITLVYLQTAFFSGTAPATGFTPTATLQRVSQVVTQVAGSTGAQPRFGINFATAGGQAIDITFRIAAPQLEKAPYVSPVTILPPAGSPAVSNAPLVASPIVYPATSKLASALIPGVGGQVNLIRNPLMLGGVTGLPGTVPTNWTTAAQGGVSRVSCNYGVDATTGLPYAEFRFTGTPTAATGNFRFDTAVGINCNPSDTFVQSVYAAITGGDLTNVTSMSLGLFSTDAVGTIVTNPGTAQTIAITTVMTRFTGPAYTLASTSTIRHIWPVLQFTLVVGQPVDFTIRVSAPQVEFGAQATDVSVPPAGTMGPSDRVLTPAMVYALVAGARLDGRGGPVNYVRNPRGEGVIPGTPGTPPTYWAVTSNGISRQIVGAGNDPVSGLDYVDFRFFGTASGTSNNIRLEPPTGIVANPGDTWSYSIYAALVGGSTNGGQVGFQFGLYVNDTTGVILSAPSPWIAVSLTASLQRFLDPADTIPNNPATGFVWPVFAFNYPNGAILDFTIRLAGAQVEYGGAITDLSLPPAGNPRLTDRVITPDSTVVSMIIGGLGGMTNWIDNPNAEGAVVGTPGTMPTNWSLGNTLGVAQQIVAMGPADPDLGLPYVDIRVFGTPTAGNNNIFFEPTRVLPSIANDVWSQSAYVAMVGGSIATGMNIGLLIYYLNAAGANIGNAPNTFFTPTGVLQRFLAPNKSTGTDVTTRFLWPSVHFNYVIGTPIDITLRIAGVQLERGTVCTPVMLPPLGSPGRTTRALLAQPAQLMSAAAEIDGSGALIAQPWLANYARINGVGQVSAAAATIAAAQARIGGLGGVRATAQVRAGAAAQFNGAGGVRATGGGLQFSGAIINGGEANYYGPGAPAIVPPNTCTVSTDIAPPFNDGSLVFIHTRNGTTGDSNSGAKSLQAAAPTGGIVPYSLRTWCWVPAGWPGNAIQFAVEGTGAPPGFATFANLALTNQWQLISVEISPPTSTTCSLVCRPNDPTATPFYTSMWRAVPDTVIAPPNQTAAAFGEIDGEGFVVPAPLGRVPTSAQISGTGSVAATVTARRAAAAEFDGVGALRANAMPLKPAFAEIDGVGTLAATPSAFATQAQASIAGTGSLSVDSQPMRAAAAQINGAGSVRMAAPALLAGAAAEFDGVGLAVGRGALRLPGIAEIDGEGFVAATLGLLLPALARIAGLGGLAADARPMRAAAALIPGGATDRLPAGVPTASAGDTVVISTDVPPPVAGADVYRHDWQSPPLNNSAGFKTVQFQPLEQYVFGAWVWVPSAFTGTYVLFQAEGGGTTTTQGRANMALRDQWQFLTGYTPVGSTGNFNVVFRYDNAPNPPSPIYTSLWSAVPITVQASATLSALAAAEFDGVGTARASAMPLRSASARINGVGDADQNPPAILATASAEIDGTGSLAANAQRIAQVWPAAAEIDGVGSLLPAPRLPALAAARINGVGAVIATITASRLAVAEIDGAGAVQASGSAQLLAVIEIDGVGSCNILPTGAQLSQVRISGQGNVAADAVPARGARATIAGVASVSAIVTAARIAASEIDGAATVGAATIAQMLGATRLAGVGGVAADAQRVAQLRPAAAEIDGQGSLTAILTGSRLAAAEIDGAGALAALLTATRLAAAEIDGVGTVAANAAGRRPAFAEIDATGSVTATSFVLLRASAQINGAGSLAAGAQRVAQLRPAAAEIDGVATVGAAPVAQMVAAVLLAGTAGVRADGLAQHPSGSQVIQGEGFISALANAVMQAVAEIDGTGGVTAAFRGLSPAAATIAGLGSLAADSVPRRAGAGQINGSGGVTAAAQLLMAAQARIAGVGSLTVDTTDTAAVAARIAGLGSVAADLLVQRPANARIAGLGSLGAAAWVLAQAAAKIDGAGSLRASVQGAVPAQAALAGVGSLRADALVQRPANTLIAGTGSLAAQAIRLGATYQVNARIDGTGSLDADGDGLAVASARIDGVGGMIAAGAGAREAQARIAGVGLVQAQGLYLGQTPAAARLIGLGGVFVAMPALRARVSRAPIAAAGHVAASANVVAAAASRVRGLGGVLGVAAVAHPAAARITGTGRVRMTGRLAFAALALLRGIGTLRARAGTEILTATARIAGIGTVRASTAGHFNVPAQATIAGAGALRANATVHRAAAALIAGEGDLDTHGRPAQFAQAAIHGAGSVTAQISVRVSVTTARLQGVGAVRATGHRLVPVGARILGRGDVDADGQHHVRDGAAIVGVGKVQADAQRRAQTYAVTAMIHGAGALRVVSRVHAVVKALIPGIGRIVARGSSHVPADARIGGSGSLRADAVKAPRVAGAILTGHGGVHADAEVHHTAFAQARISGLGALGATVSNVLHAIHAQARISGLGALHADTTTHLAIHAQARLDGRGAVQAIAHVAQSAHARITGRGAVMAHAAVLLAARAQIAGMGRVRATLHRLLLAGSRIAGIGHVSGQPVVHALIYAEALLDGEGSVYADPHIPRERVAALGVYLPPTPRGAALPPQTGGDATLPPTRRSVTV